MSSGPLGEYRITLLGAGSVGKSALTIQLVHKHFVSEYDPTIEDSYKTTTNVDQQVAVLEILDTAGQDDFNSMQDQWIREGEGFLVVYAINSKMSLEAAKNLREKILRAKNSNRVPMVLVGNKCDLESERVISKSEGQNLANNWDCPFFECSAKNRINHPECFFQVVREIRKMREKNEKSKKDTKERGLFATFCSIL
jgi:GTPase KRas protein